MFWHNKSDKWPCPSWSWPFRAFPRPFHGQEQASVHQVLEISGLDTSGDKCATYSAIYWYSRKLHSVIFSLWWGSICCSKKGHSVVEELDSLPTRHCYDLFSHASRWPKALENANFKIFHRALCQKIDFDAFLLHTQTLKFGPKIHFLGGWNGIWDF